MGRINSDTPPDIDKEVDKMKHLSDIQKVMLKALLKRHEELFDGQLGKWRKCDPAEIELKESAMPYHTRAFPIPHIDGATFKKDLCPLVSSRRSPTTVNGRPLLCLLYPKRMEELSLSSKTHIATYKTYATKSKQLYICYSSGSCNRLPQHRAVR